MSSLNLKSVHFSYRKNHLFVEEVPMSKIAETFGTPTYIYSSAEVRDHFLDYENAFANVPHLICYSLKANSNLALCRLLSTWGAGADIVSRGELHKALSAGFRPQHIIFSGVGKTRDELVLAVKKGVRLINVESEEELRVLNEVATTLRRPACFSLRVNPDVHAGGHPHLSTGTPANKFGVYYKNIFPLYQWARKQPYLKPVGIQSHIGSQILQVAPLKRALAVLLELVHRLEEVNVSLEIIDLGGGLGVNYNNESPATPADLARSILPLIRERGLTLVLEPGRSLVAQSGLLVTQVLYRKDAGSKHFVVVDAAMNDLARPALYDAYHEIRPLRMRTGKKISVDVVGPVCESGDYLARNRSMVLPQQKDFLAVFTAGAYGYSMSSQYNLRPRGAEVLVSGSRFDLIRERERAVDLSRGERIPSFLK